MVGREERGDIAYRAVLFIQNGMGESGHVANSDDEDRTAEKDAERLTNTHYMVDNTVTENK